jgi:antigen flippase
MADRQDTAMSRLAEPPHPGAVTEPSSGETEAALAVATRWAGRQAVAETIAVNGLLLGLGAVSGILAARLLGPQGRGALALGVAVAGLLTVVVGLGLQQGFAYLVAGRRESARMAVSLSVLNGILLGGLTVGVAWALVLLAIGNETVSSVVRICLIAVPGSAIAMNTTGVLQGLRLGRRFNLSRLLYPCTYCLGIVVTALVVNRVTPAKLASVYAVGSAIGALGAYYLVPASLRRLRAPSPAFTTSSLRYGARAVAGGLAVAASAQIAVPLVGAFAGLRETGYYAVGLSYAIPVTFVASAIAMHTLPDIAAAQGDVRIRLIRHRVTVALLTLLPIAATALLVTPLLVPAVFGAEFHPAVRVAQILVLAQSFRALANVLGDIARGLGHPGVPSVAETTGIIASIILLAVLVPGLGAEGAAIAVGIGTVGVVCLTAVGIKRTLGPLRPRPRSG